MKSSGKTNTQWRRMSGPSAMESLNKRVRCRYVDGIIVCPKHFLVLPYHEGRRRDYCPKHRELLNQIEAEELINKWKNK